MAYETERRKLIDNAPGYIGTLIATDYIHCEITTTSPLGSPVIAWTDFDESASRWVVHFHPAAAQLSSAAQYTLWRHEVGHIFFAHFSQEFCMPDDPMRSQSEAMQVGDIQINYYLERKTMEEIGKLAKQINEDATGEKTEGPGFIDPEEALPRIGLPVAEYSYDIIHAYLHEKNEEEGNGSNWTENMLSQMCGGIKFSKPGGLGETKAAVIGNVMVGGEKELGEKLGLAIGSLAGNFELRLRPNALPDWVAALESFARSIVTTVLADKRSHTRPQEVYKSYGVHIPTSRPRWAYKADQVCLLVDTSGSMGDELKYVMPVVQYLNQHEISVRLIAGDTRVTVDELCEPGMVLPTKVGGGGGTEISPLFDRAKDYDPASIVCFSDGYVSFWPNDPGVPVLFVGCQTDVPWGQKA